MKGDGLKGRRSDCPVNFAVETLGDKWSLVILRDMIFWGKRSYGEFLQSDERIATNVLAGRLEYLVREGLIERSQHETDRRKEIYRVTELGIALVPMLIEMIAWSAANTTWQTMEHCGTREQVRFVERVARAKSKAAIIREVQELVRSGRSVFGKDRASG